LEITTPARGQEMGTRTGNFPVLPPLRACMRGQEIGILLNRPLSDVEMLLGALLRGGDRILPYNRELRGRECAKRGQDGHEERMEA
jgi:hypothetical protein